MRTRDLKPGFFKNEELARLHPYARILFQGLWLIADREGRLKDLPILIRAEVFPYEPRVPVEAHLRALAQNGFILRYSVSGKRYIQVIQFTPHQHPHPREVPSVIPAPSQGNSPSEATPKVGPEATPKVRPEARPEDTPRSGLGPAVSSFPSSTSGPSGSSVESSSRDHDRPPAEDDSSLDFVVRVVTAYSQTAGTPGRATPADRKFASKLQREGLELELVLDALLTGAARRSQGENPEPIRSLRYFEPVIRELQRTPLPPGYAGYMRSRLAAGAPADDDFAPPPGVQS